MTWKQTQSNQAGWLQGHPEPDYGSLPDAAEARRDGKLGQPIEDGKDKIVAVMEDGSNKRCESLRVEGEILENKLAEAEAEEARWENEVARVGSPVDSPILTLVFFVLVFFVIHGEARMLQGGIAVLLSSGLTQYGYESGLLVAAIGSVLLKIAMARWRVQGTPTANSKVRVAIFIVAVFTVVTTALMRSYFMESVEALAAGNKPLADLFAANRGIIAVMFVAYAVGLWVASALLLERVSQSIEAHTAAWHLSRARKSRLEIANRLDAIKVALATAPDRLKHEVARRLAEYQYEYNLGRLGDQTPTESEVFTGFLKFASTAAASVLAGGVTGAIAYVATKSPMPAVVAGSVVALLAGGAMTWFNRGAGSVLAVIVLLGASVLNSGCRASGPSPQGVAFVIDTSKSVRMTDEQRLSAVRGVVPRLGRCTQLLIMPVNAEAGDSYALSIPCEGVIFDADIKNAVEALNGELPKKLADWRGKGDRSDYRWTLRQAVEAVKPFKKRTIIVIGDMVDDRDTHPASTVPGVPDLPREGLRGTTVYLGWAKSTVLDRLPDRQRDQFLERWKDALENAGASVLSGAFGLQGLDAFAECHFSPSKSCPTEGELKP